jgi:hypothetical protein
MLLANLHVSKKEEKQLHTPLGDLLSFSSTNNINLHVTQEANPGPPSNKEGWTTTINKLISPFHLYLARCSVGKQGLATLADENTNCTLFGSENHSNGSIQILRFGASNENINNRARFLTVFNVYAPHRPSNY